MTEGLSRKEKDSAVELAVDCYGGQAILRPSPPGPDRCTGACEYCYHQGVTILTPRDSSEVEEKVAESGGA